MKILKLTKSIYDHYYAVFDIVPEITYEKVGLNYIGSAIDSEGRIIASRYLGYERFKGAFGGRELKLKMKDGSIKKIKDYWYDWGWCKEHGEFVGIGAGTLDDLQRCYVYCSYNINKKVFESMIEDYLKKDRLYGYDEIREWCNLQYDWYNVVVNGEKIPFMMNKYGDMVEKETKKRVFCRYNKSKKINGKYKTYTYFRFQYNDGNRLRKIEANYLDVLKATLPFSEEEIKKNCKIPLY